MPVELSAARPCGRIAVLISGRGSNLQALAEAIAAGELDAQIVAVGCDRADAVGLQVALDHAIPVVLTPRSGYPSRQAFESTLFEQIQAYRPDWLVLAGFMRVLSAEAVDRWRDRMINLHPSLLPLYPGLDTHTRALAAGDQWHGASVHLVTAQLDGGPVLAQTRIQIRPDDNAQSLGERLRPLEHRLLIEVVQLLVAGRLSTAGGAVTLDGRALLEPVLYD